MSSFSRCFFDERPNSEQSINCHPLRKKWALNCLNFTVNKKYVLIQKKWGIHRLMIFKLFFTSDRIMSWILPTVRRKKMSSFSRCFFDERPNSEQSINCHPLRKKCALNCLNFTMSCCTTLNSKPFAFQDVFLMSDQKVGKSSV